MNDPSTKSDSTLPGELLAGVLGAGVSVICVLPPLLHLLTGPLGPFIGGFVAASRVRPGARGRAIIAITIATGLSSILGGAAAVLMSLSTPSELPDWFPGPATLAAVLAIVWLYAAVLSTVGIAVSAAVSRKHAAESGEAAE